MSERIKKAKRRYTIELFAAMALYVVVLIVSLSIAKPLEPGLMLTALALAPLAPLLLACFSFFRFYQRTDEMQKRVSADAAALTLVVAFLVAVTLGFLRRFGVLDFEDDMMLFGPFLIIVWGLMRVFLGGRDC
jgi:hypothetical protein